MFGRYKRLKLSVVASLVFMTSAGTIWALSNEFGERVRMLADEIALGAAELQEATAKPGHNRAEVAEILGELKNLIEEYEEAMAFWGRPRRGEIFLGSTPGGDSDWLETLCNSRYKGLIKEIRIRRTGHRAIYLRISDIEVTYSTPIGWGKQVFNKGGRAKLYGDGVFKLVLPRPMRIKRIRIKIDHESAGLEVYGVPYHVPIVKRPVVKDNGVREVLLGTTPGGDSTWLETLCSPTRGAMKEIRLKRTGMKASYLRVNDIEITYLTPMGPRKEVFNKNGRSKLYYNGVYRLALPKPMRITKIRVLVNHESTGLEVYGVCWDN